MTREISYGSMEEIAMQEVIKDGLPSSHVVSEELGKVDPEGKEAHEITKKHREGRGRLWGPEILGIW